MNSITSLPKTLIDKLHATNKTAAPLLIASRPEGDEVLTLLELPCGHVLRQKDSSSARSAGFGPLGSNEVLGDLLIG